MDTINGIFCDAKIFTTNNLSNAIDDYALAQIQMICDNEVSKGSQIRIMPDVHPGKVGTIGLTMTVGERIIPNLIGIDIGCGMSLMQIKGKNIEGQKLDTVIRDNVPTGFASRLKNHKRAYEFPFELLLCCDHIRIEKAMLGLGTLGSGNHFIEVDKDADGNLYVVVHTGSRHLGKEVTEYYINQGQKELKAKGINVPHELTYLEGALMEDYLHDLQIVQDYAALNREIILEELAKGMKWKVLDTYSCHHNYVDNRKGTIELIGASVLRKGAISAHKGEKVIIPINMRDGIILREGLGNTDWNCSAPHGSGRIMKREEVKSHFTVSNYKAEMKGIYSSCIGKETLDEAPFAYRNIKDIADAIQDTVLIHKVIKPIYNYKGGGN